MRIHGRTFHLASRLLGAEHADNAARLYSFCREVDDIADDAGGDPAAVAAARARLGRLRSDVVAGTDGDPSVTDLLHLCRDTGADPAHAALLIDGVLSDLGRVAIADQPQLLRYAYSVAGIVGLMMVDVLGAVDRRAAGPFAIDLGIAMQLTNIARDVREDALRGRRYLPAEWVGDLTPEQIVRADPATREVLRAGSARLLTLAERHYASAREGLAHLPRRPRATVLVAAQVYRQIGVRLARDGHRVWAGRTVVPASARARVAAGALVRRPELWSQSVIPAQHDSQLHAHLEGLPGTAAPARG